MKTYARESLPSELEDEEAIGPAPVAYLLHGSENVVRMVLSDADNAAAWRARGEAVEELFSASQISDMRSDLARLADLEESVENAHMAASETQPSWKHRCHYILSALGADYGDPDWMMPGDLRKLDAALARVAELEARLQEKTMGQDEVARLLGLESDLRKNAVVFDPLPEGEAVAWHVRSIGANNLISSHATRWDAISAAAKFEAETDA